ncbi:hypothetical protein Ae168Ps1_0132 [Pseudonocardia sp. Ae168_Ps1]|uniref:DUF6412 domain-containing protein n=1 Tax=unclassified Pseudonocardia TaxID=2619320 RepID=UPI00094B6761|nr:MULTISPECIES: DUF6412 domain-containing protein [unclassified Pseudonocardia]OLL71758.1 hypothetical protein Ae150APs1_0136 [Pseudonocardia sp. Ae150A_Ps1]OLL77726.1 hypothetical protein Ae168Ps1_0132 [Pseudonocardia sp. Ae168_Ps1]OLL88151.1 hypothetical protein Ae263Ps1_5206c [Pseudonocardia sp. Ae263_Ps1]OLL91823.1 hypothetical protein Ae356Ps1_1720 [Pseudonocardia sp. Ae356_Ps1]
MVEGTAYRVDRVRDAAAVLLASVLASLLVLVPVLLPVDGDAGLVGAVVALAVLAWTGGRELGSLRLLATTATTPVREALRGAHRAGASRQCDPDADGRPRPRAPGLPVPLEQTIG